MFGSDQRRFAVGATLLMTIVFVQLSDVRADDDGDESGLRDGSTFTFVDQIEEVSEGEIQIEQQLMWSASKAEDHGYDDLEFGHEFEFGITDQFELELGVSWGYEDGDSVDDDGIDFRTVSLEAMYHLIVPDEDTFGLAVMGEIAGGDDLLELESEIIIQKPFGDWLFVWNGRLEAEWSEDGLSESDGGLAQQIGLQYAVSPTCLLGAELIHEIEIAQWEEFEDSVLYLGPVAAYSTESFWFAVTPVFQITDNAEEPDFMTRFVFGMEF